ncbi:MAG: diaminopimelate epimerase [Longimicrobiales bacterium]
MTKAKPRPRSRAKKTGPAKSPAAASEGAAAPEGAPARASSLQPPVSVSKGCALGNDYLVADAADLPAGLTPELVRAVCDRHEGVGADGILLGDVATQPFGLRVFNPDGTEAEKSGNGLRIFGAWLHGRGLVGRESFRVRLPKDEVELEILGEDDAGELDITAAMGRPDFRPDAVGFRVEVALEELAAGGANARMPGARAFRLGLGDGLTAIAHPVSLANPHCVVLVDALDRADFLARAPRLCTHEAFERGTNVQFARVSDDATLEAWIWERGVGETRASGSSSCAVSAVACSLGRVKADALDVRMPGGTARVTLAPDGVLHLRGPARIVLRAEIPAAIWDGWASAGAGAGD